MGISSRIAYHLDELEVAQDPSSKDYIMPQVLPTDRTILDIGCGVGQTLIGLNLEGERTLVGVDIEFEPLAYGHQKFNSVRFANCSAEHLPFTANTYDLIISRVALPYTNIPQVVKEMYRVLKPGGRIWITLHPPQKTWQQLLSAIKGLKFKDIIFRKYILTNGIYFHLVGKLFAFPFNNRYESFQTNKSITDTLVKHGFSDVVVTRNRHFLVVAKK